MKASWIRGLTAVLLAIGNGTPTPAGEAPITYPAHVTTAAQKEAWRIGWPHWLGPNWNCSAIDCGYELTDDITKARKLWQSEEIMPGQEFWVGKRGIRTGYSSSMLAAGRLYVYYTWPQGLTRDFSQVTADQLLALKDGDVGDDIMICIDALTGKTLWKKVHEKKGEVLKGSGKDGGGFTPTIADGRAFFLGSNGWFYCFDAVTGDELWSCASGARSAHNGIPVVLGSRVAFFADGVVRAFTCADGKLLWTTKNSLVGGLRGSGQLLAWSHDGEEMYLVESAKAALDPDTGETLWTLPGSHTSGNQTAISGSYWVLNGSFTKVPANNDLEAPVPGCTGPFCYRISRKGATKVWELPPVFNASSGSAPGIYKNYVYIWGNWVYGRHKTLNGKGPCLKATIELETGKVVARWSFADKYWAYQQILAEGKRYYQGDLSVAAGPDSRPLPTVKDPTEALLDSVPNYACGLMFVRNPTGLAGYDLRTHQ